MLLSSSHFSHSIWCFQDMMWSECPCLKWLVSCHNKSLLVFICMIPQSLKLLMPFYNASSFYLLMRSLAHKEALISLPVFIMAEVQQLCCKTLNTQSWSSFSTCITRCFVLKWTNIGYCISTGGRIEGLCINIFNGFKAGA